jgi:nitroreductase
MSTLDVIKKRTSYRGKYKDTPVPKEDLIKIMEAGLAAPSGCNTQTTSLIAIDDKDLLKKLYVTAQADGEDKAPAMICVLTQRLVAYRDGNGNDRYFNVHDYCAAIENMLLATIALGYETCWYEGYITDADAIGRQMADVLGVPSDYELICYLPVGVAAESTKHPDKKPFEERAWFNGFKV